MNSMDILEKSGHANTEHPKFWDLLSEEDKNGYNSLRATFDDSTYRRKRGKRIETFDDILFTIRRFSKRDQNDDWKRFLVCGICWMENAIAVNIRQLRILISKCKSSINGSLQKLGYYANTYHSESWKILFEMIPKLKNNFAEIRQWTIRYKLSMNKAQIDRSLTPMTCLVNDNNSELSECNKITEDDENIVFPIKFRIKFGKLK